MSEKLIKIGRTLHDGEREYNVFVVPGTCYFGIAEDDGTIHSRPTFEALQALVNGRAARAAQRERAQRRKEVLDVTVLVGHGTDERLEDGTITGLSVDGRQALGSKNVKWRYFRGNLLRRLTAGEVAEFNDLNKAVRKAEKDKERFLDTHRLDGDPNAIARLIEDGEAIRLKSGAVYREAQGVGAKALKR